MFKELMARGFEPLRTKSKIRPQLSSKFNLVVCTEPAFRSCRDSNRFCENFQVINHQNLFHVPAIPESACRGSQ